MIPLLVGGLLRGGSAAVRSGTKSVVARSGTKALTNIGSRNVKTTSSKSPNVSTSISPYDRRTAIKQKADTTAVINTKDTPRQTVSKDIKVVSNTIQDISDVVTRTTNKALTVSNKIPTTLSKTDIRQRQIAEDNFRDKLIDNLEDIKKAANETAENTKDIQETETKEPRMSFPGFETLREKAGQIKSKVEEDSSWVGAALLGLMSAVGGIISWWKTATAHEGGIVGWFWDKIKSTAISLGKIISEWVESEGGWMEVLKKAGMKTLETLAKIGDLTLWLIDKTADILANIHKHILVEYGGWGNFLWEKVKDSTVFLAGVFDWTLEALFGNNWKVLRDWLKNKLIKVAEWWEEVEKWGFGSWIYNYLYDYAQKVSPDLAKLLPESKKASIETEVARIKVKSEKEQVENKKQIEQKYRKQLQEVDKKYRGKNLTKKQQQEYRDEKTAIGMKIKEETEKANKRTVALNTIRTQKVYAKVNTEQRAQPSVTPDWIKNQNIDISNTENYKNGVNISVKNNTNITSPFDGVIEEVGNNYVTIMSSITKERLKISNISNITHKQGDRILPNEQIGIFNKTNNSYTGVNLQALSNTEYNKYVNPAQIMRNLNINVATKKVSTASVTNTTNNISSKKQVNTTSDQQISNNYNVNVNGQDDQMKLSDLEADL